MLSSWTLPETRTAQEDCGNCPATLTAAADVMDDGNGYKLVLEMPGVTQDQLEVDLERRELVVRGKRQAPGEKYKLLYNGRYASSTLERRFSIGDDIDRAHINAELKDGLLFITLPRKAEVKSKRIDVQVK